MWWNKSVMASLDYVTKRHLELDETWSGIYKKRMEVWCNADLTHNITPNSAIHKK